MEPRIHVLLLPKDSGMPILSLDLPRGYQSLNEAIAARWGTSVSVRVPEVAKSATRSRLSVDLWCDDEGLMGAEPIVNARASMLAGQMIVGDALVLTVNAEGETVSVPDGIAQTVRTICDPNPRWEIRPLR